MNDDMKVRKRNGELVEMAFDKILNSNFLFINDSSTTAECFPDPITIII